MKKTLAVIATVMITVTGYSQGTFIFNNFDPAHGIDAKVVNLFTLQGLGAGFTAQMLLVNGTSTTPLLPTTTFQTGAAAGYVNVPTDPITVPGIPAGSKATLRMLAFNGSAFSSSTIVASSRDVTITLGGGGLPPAPLIGLTSFLTDFTTLPEPSTIALGLLGMAALFNKMKAAKRSR